MKIFKSFFLFTSLFSVFLITGCKKDDNVNPQNDNPPQFTVKTIRVPDAMAQSNDPGAQQTASYLNMMNGIAGYSDMMREHSKSITVNGLKDSGPRIFTWDVDEGNTHCTFTLTVTETDILIKWKMVIDGIMDGDKFDNFLFLEAQEYKDGTNSRITVYDPENPGIILMKMSWTKENDVYHFIFEVPENLQIVVDINIDNSGTMDVNEWIDNEWAVVFNAVWGPDGHGQWHDNNGNGSW